MNKNEALKIMFDFVLTFKLKLHIFEFPDMRKKTYETYYGGHHYIIFTFDDHDYFYCIMSQRFDLSEAKILELVEKGGFNKNLIFMRNITNEHKVGHKVNQMIDNIMRGVIC